VNDDNRIKQRCTLDKTSKPAHRQPKAYQDTRFLESKDARALRILAEYMEPLYRFQRHNIQDTIVFMGSARLRSEEAAKAALAEAERAGQGIEAAHTALRLSIYYEEARELAQRLTAWSKKLPKITLVSLAAVAERAQSLQRTTPS
jgi:hypothetical protein